MPLSFDDLSADDIHRFWSAVNASSPDECWVWTRALDSYGYGHFSVAGYKRGAHRISYLIDRGDLPEVVRHTCDNRCCVNPNHLRGGTQQDNIEDRQRRDRQAKGRRNGRSKLDAETVRELRRRYAETDVTYRALADELDMNHKSIAAAIKGKTWGHVA